MKVLILGASYGSLVGTKLLLAGHDAHLVCTAPTAELIEREGTIVRFPIRGREGLVDVPSKALPGTVTASVPGAVEPGDFDLAVLGMQEPQYGSSGVRELMGRIAAASVPSVAIMNIPPIPYLSRIDGLDVASVSGCYTQPGVWDGFAPGLVTLSSPDPQAFRPPDAPKNVLQVGLPTNFKTAPFEDEANTELLRRLESDIVAARFDPGDGPLEIPVKLKVHDSLFVPLAKWPMLITGNYRCIRPEGMISIRDAVHGDLEASRTIYAWVGSVCEKLGASSSDLVPFEKYAKAAEGLLKPSSAARTLDAGASAIERVDSLVLAVARQLGMDSDELAATTRLVDERLASNRAAG